MELLLNRFGQVAPDLSNYCSDLVVAIREYAKSNSTVASVKAQTDIISNDFNAMSTWDLIGITKEVLEKVDNINGEVIE